jgi:hypothetical protein
MQTALRLTLAQRTELVTVDTARAVRGVDAESILAEIDDGRIPWAFDVSVLGSHQSERRELRLWATALLDGEATAKLAAEQVLDTIIGTHRETLRAPEVERLLLCSAQHVARLHATGALVGHRVGNVRHLTRASLAQFLRTRRVT